jgi:hypothetical protein
MKNLNFAFVVALFAFPSLALATPGVMSSFKKAYPTTKLVVNCKVCHDGAPPRLNPYGSELVKAQMNFQSIEGLDSDGDGFTNIAEINAGTNPGDKNSFPATPAPVTPAAEY